MIKECRYIPTLETERLIIRQLQAYMNTAIKTSGEPSGKIQEGY